MLKVRDCEGRNRMMRKTLIILAGIMIAGMAAADFDVLYSGDSAPTAIDLLDKKPVVDNLKIPWDVTWIGGNANATVVISDNDTEVRHATGAGEFMHEFSCIGRHDLTYVTYINGVAQKEIYSATIFNGWEYEVKDGGAVIVGTTHTTGDVIIPSIIDGYPVTGVWGSIFKDNDPVRSLVIPEGVKEIGWCAFNGVGLDSVTIP